MVVACTAQSTSCDFLCVYLQAFMEVDRSILSQIEHASQVE